MKVGDQIVGYLETVAGHDIKVTPAFGGLHLACPSGGKLQGADGGGAHGPDFPSSLSYPVDCCRILLRDMDILLMDGMFKDGLGAHRGKGAVAHMQGDPGDDYAFFPDLFEQGFREMETGGGGGYRPWLIGIDGLIALAVFGGAAVVPSNIRGERDLAVMAEDCR